MRYSIVGATAAQIAAAGGTNIKETRVAIYADLTPEQVNKLRAAGCVVSRVADVKAAVLPPAPIAAQPRYSVAELTYAAGVEEIRRLITPPVYGEGFNCAVVGTGIRETHELIGGKVVWSKNYTIDRMSDGFDHDTGVASIIHTIVPGCNLLNLKVLNSKGEGTEEEVVLAVDELITMYDSSHQYAPHVINMSLGSQDVGDPANPMRAICRKAIDKGILVICAAGNSGPNPGTILSPACEENAIAVGSCSFQPFTISSFSSRGPTKEGITKPDIMFFGEDLVMASSASDTTTKANTGTSFSAPSISGAGILFKNIQQVFSTTAISMPSVYRGMFERALVMFQSIESADRLIKDFFPVICTKPQGVAVDKDNDYGSGLLFGPALWKNLGFAPSALSLELIMPMITLAMVIPSIIKMLGR